MQKCPICNSSLIEDVHNGELVCSNCGYVAKESMFSFYPEHITTDMEEKIRSSRNGAPLTYSMHDLGLSTEIGNIDRDYNGNKIGSIVRSQMNNARLWQSRIKVSSSKERRLSNVLKRINEFCSNLQLPKIVNEEAAFIYRNYERNNAAKGKMVNAIALAAIYLACKKAKIIKSLDEIAIACNINDDKIIHLAGKYYRELLIESNNEGGQHVNNIERYITKIVNTAKLDPKIAKIAIELAKKTSNPTLTNGKDPSGLASAYIYIAATWLDNNIHQRDIALLSNVTEVTIRNRCREIIENYNIKLVLKCKNAAGEI